MNFLKLCADTDSWRRREEDFFYQSYPLSHWIKGQLNMSPVLNFGVMRPIRTASPSRFSGADRHCAHRAQGKSVGSLKTFKCIRHFTPSISASSELSIKVKDPNPQNNRPIEPRTVMDEDWKCLVLFCSLDPWTERNGSKWVNKRNRLSLDIQTKT